MNSVAVAKKPKEELINHDVPIKRLQEKNEKLFNGLTKKAKSITLPLVPSPLSEGLAHVQDWHLRNGSFAFGSREG